MTPPRIAFISNALGLGGTEKGLVELALGLDRERFDPLVIGVDELGVRAAQLEAAGIEVACADGDDARLAALLEGTAVAHVFRAGNAEPRVPAAVRRAGVARMVETNIFGNVDASGDRDAFDAHLFISKMCLLRYRDRLGAVPDGFHRNHRVLLAPIGLDDLRSRAPSKAEARATLGLDPDRPVVGRVGRAADLKWRNLLVDMVPRLLELAPETQVLFVGATPAKIARLERLGVRDRVVLHDPVLDPDRVAAFYAACDVFVGAAEIGESQGMANNEAMALGVPVVTCSTPWADNAQVEFVTHGETGWYASHPSSFAEAVADLVNSDARREAFGAAAAEEMTRTLAREPIVRRLETLYAGLVEDGAPPVAWDPDAAAVEAFAAEYARRAVQEFRPLTARERAEVRATRARERAGMVATVARGRLAGRAPGGLADRLARGEASGGWRGAAMRGYLAVHRGAQRAGLHVVRASYDSPIPRAEDLTGTFERVSPMRGVDWDPERQLRFAETELAPYLAEFSPSGGFAYDNHTYDRVDADLLYALTRWSRPARHVELGSGYSTLVAAAALERNGTGDLRIYDPYPSPHVTARPDLAARVRPTSAQGLDEAVVRELEAGDILFVDTTHTVKQGGDVNRIVLDLLPLVAPGVLVHFHDIFLPGDYSPGHIANAHYWTEQYLLQAFLSGNRDWEVLIGGQAIVRHDPARVGALIPSFREGVSPGAMWLRRVGQAGSSSS